MAPAPSKIRVVIAGQPPPPVGGQNLNIARMLNLLGKEQDMEVLHWKFRFTPEWQDGRKSSFSKTLELFRVMFRLLKLRLGGPLDIVIYPSGGPHFAPIVRDILLLPWAAFWSRRVVVQFRAAGIYERLPKLSSLTRALLRFAYSLCHGALTLSHFGKRDPFALGLSNVNVISNGFEDSEWAQTHLKERRLPQRSVPRFINVGHLCPDKGTPQLLEACALAIREGAQPFHLHLIGECLPPYSEEQLKRDMSRLGLQDVVTCQGLLRNEALLRAYREADLFIFCTVAPYESFGMVLIEAMQHGLPIVASDWRANSEVLSHDFGGCLTETGPNFPQHLANSLQDMLQQQDRWTSWGQQNRSIYLQRYTLGQLQKNLSSYLRQQTRKEQVTAPLPTARPEADRYQVVVAGKLPPPYGGQNIMIERIYRTLLECPSLQVCHWSLEFTKRWQQHSELHIYKFLELFTSTFRLLSIRLRTPIDHLLLPAGGPSIFSSLRDLYLLLVAKSLSKRVTLYFHAAGISTALAKVSPLFRRIIQRLASGYTGAVVLTEYGRSDAQALGISNIQVIPNGIEDVPPELQRDWKARPLSTTQAVRLLHVGHVCASKGIEQLLRATEILRDRGISFELNIVGECLPPYTEMDLIENLDRNNLHGLVTYHGLCRGRELLAHYRNNDLFIFASIAPYESFGLVVVEAMRARLPVVATKWRGNEEVLGPDPGGVYCEVKGDWSKQLADSIQAATQQRAMWPQWGEQNRKRYLEKFTLDTYREKIEAYLLEAISK